MKFLFGGILSEPFSEAEDILLLWQSTYGQLDEELREEFLNSDIVEELCYFHINVIQSAILANNLILKDILTYAQVHPYNSHENTVRLNSVNQEPDIGAYMHDGKIYSVRINRKLNQIQAWEYDKEKKEYRRPFFSADERRILYSLTPSNRLTLRLAQKYSIETGICCHCGRYLSAKKSVAAGMGPVCRKYYH